MIIKPNYDEYTIEDVLRQLCFFLGINGYNDNSEEFNVERYINKILDEYVRISSKNFELMKNITELKRKYNV